MDLGGIQNVLLKPSAMKFPGTYEGDPSEDFFTSGGYVFSTGHLLQPCETCNRVTGLH